MATRILTIDADTGEHGHIPLWTIDSSTIIGTEPPTPLTVQTTRNGQLYADVASNVGRTTIWVWVDSTKQWLPASCCWVAVYKNEPLAVDEIVSIALEHPENDVFSVGEVHILNLQKFINDSVSFTELLSFDWTRTFADVVSAGEQVALYMSLPQAESVSADDAFLKSTHKHHASGVSIDDMSIGDIVSKFISITKNNIVITSEVLAKDTSRIASDSVAPIDSLHLCFGGGGQSVPNDSALNTSVLN